MLEKLTGRVEGYREFKRVKPPKLRKPPTPPVKPPTPPVKPPTPPVKPPTPPVAAGGAADAAGGAADAAGDAGNMFTRNPGRVAAALAASGFVGYGIYQAQKSEDTPLTITNITPYTDGGSKTEYTVTYTPTLEILQTDGVTITGSRTVPSIDGSPSAIVKIRGPSSFVLDFGVSLTKLDPGGTIKISSSFLAQAGTAAGEAAGAVAGAAGQAAGSGFGAAAKGIGAGVGSLFSSLGLGEYTMYIGGASALCSCLCCMMIVAYILKQVNH
jgi:hypothetical protein